MSSMPYIIFLPYHPSSIHGFLVSSSSIRNCEMRQFLPYGRCWNGQRKSKEMNSTKLSQLGRTHSVQFAYVPTVPTSMSPVVISYDFSFITDATPLGTPCKSKKHCFHIKILFKFYWNFLKIRNSRSKVLRSKETKIGKVQGNSP